MLEGIRVVDLGNNIAGPCVSTILAGLGAEVVKVERPGSGDASRNAPPYVGASGVSFAPDGNEDAVSIAFLKRNSGKRSVEVDLHTTAGKKVFRRILGWADVLVENFRPGVLAKLGFTEEVLQEVNPGLIVCSITGFGQTGPKRDWLAYNTMIVAMSSMLSNRGGAAAPAVLGGVMGQSSGPALADWCGALYGAIGVLGALVERERPARQQGSRKGSRIDLAMFEALATLVWESNVDLDSEAYPAAAGRRASPWNEYPVADGHVFICVYTDRHWELLRDVMGISSEDPRFADRIARISHNDELDLVISEWTKVRKRDDIVSQLQGAGVAASPVLSAQELLDDEHVRSRSSFVPLNHPTLGEIDDVHAAAFPLWVNGERLQYKSGPPALGNANAEWLTDDDE